jgi:hypothetical protein
MSQWPVRRIRARHARRFVEQRPVCSVSTTRLQDQVVSVAARLGRSSAALLGLRGLSVGVTAQPLRLWKVHPRRRAASGEGDDIRNTAAPVSVEHRASDDAEFDAEFICLRGPPGREGVGRASAASSAAAHLPWPTVGPTSLDSSSARAR